MKLSTKILILIFLVIVDYLLISLYLRNQNLEPSIAIIVLVPIAFLINILIAIIFFFIKKTSLTSIFVINAILSSIITYYSFGNEMRRQSSLELESWSFKRNDTLFELNSYKKRNEFDMSYSLSSGSSGNFLNGKYIKQQNGIILISDSIKMRIEGNKIIGFGKTNDTIGIFKER